MADTDTETLPNGTATLTEEEEERLKQRPADIDADVREMERRKRVEALMSSKLFREELERVLDQQIHEGGDAPLLQRIREMVGGRLHSGSLRGPTCVLPINDIRGIEGVGYEKGEKILRCKLAAVYRLVDLFGWTQTGLNGQITARLNTAVEQVLTTPRGLLPHEVTASSLVKVDMQGAVQDQGTTNFPVNVEGFSIHAAVHSARPDLRCVVHVRAGAALAVSCLQRGLLPLSHEAAALGDWAMHRAPRGILDNEEKDKLVRALGPHSKVLILANAGALCCGATLEEAFHHARLLTAAADVQLRLSSIPMDQLSMIDEETRREIYEAHSKPPADAAKWRAGGEEFEALMRMLDNAGFRTGYIYRHPLIKNDVPRPKNDVEVPPAVSSLGYLLEEEELYKQGLWKKGQGKTGERTRWLNSPNVYQKVEVLETGTNDPKKITKWVDANNEEWVQDGSPAHSSTPVKIDTLQFVPKNTNPKEFKKLQQQIKDNRRADKISAGPQSHILEGVTWDEASKLVAEDAANTHTGDHVVLMGAASKGIIQRGYQHNATMYSAPYARNPFDHVTDNEIEAYRRAVERKGRSDYDTDLSESEAISGAQITSPASAPSETEEESRDEHRVLRIETMQAPVRSQPEVVLSDVDTTDFLNAERAHADRTKETRDPTPFSDDDVFLPSAVKTGVHSVITARAHHRVVGRDPNLLSDDEVFLDSAASTVTSSMTSGLTSGMTSGVTSPQPPAQVVIRAQHTAVAQTVARGTKETNTLSEALSANKRSVHDYTRSSNFDNIVKIYESPNKNDVRTSHPKCKVSLNSRLHSNEPLASSRSSLYSIPSIEWDGRAKSDYALRTQSLGRQKSDKPNKLYRTYSHSGFINYTKDPEPKHYHLPRCRSCGATNVTYTWELTKEEKKKTHRSLYSSVDDLPRKCADEFEPVKVKETIVPVFKLEKPLEFVESQEFTEDNYLGELGTSFSSENQTVIEKHETIIDYLDVTVTVDRTDDKTKAKDENGEIYRAECAIIEPLDDKDESVETEGEYHSFTDDFEEAYESPVKDLVDKDIRDYSVPIDFYCDDYVKKIEKSQKKSPFKGREVPKTILEPILEESKSSYGEDTSNFSSNGSQRDSVVQTLAEETIENILKAAVAAVDLKSEKEQLLKIYQPSEKKTDIKENPNKSNAKDSSDKENFKLEIDQAANISNCNKAELSRTNDDQRKISIEYSVASSTAELITLDSTVEFEKYEAISELLMSLLNKIDYDNVNKDFFLTIDKRNKDVIEYITDVNNAKQKVDVVKDENESELIVGEISEIRPPDEFIAILCSQDGKDYSENCIQDKKEIMSDEEICEQFSITKLIHDLEHCHLSETILTETSDSSITESFKIAESLLYYVFDRIFYVFNNKNKKKTSKSVVTVVDPEDILYTAQTIWLSENEQLDMESDTFGKVNFDDNQEMPADNLKETQENNESVSHPEVIEHDALVNVFFVNEDLEGDLNNNIEEFEERRVIDLYYSADIDLAVVNELEKVDNDLTENYFYYELEDSKDNLPDMNLELVNCTPDAISHSIEEVIVHHSDSNKIRESLSLHAEPDKIHKTGSIPIQSKNNSVNSSVADLKIERNVFENFDQETEGFNNKFEKLDEHAYDFNSTVDSEEVYIESNICQDTSTDDTECKELSETSLEVAEEIVYKLFNNIIQNDGTEFNTTKHTLNKTCTEQGNYTNRDANIRLELNATYNDLNIVFSDDETNRTTTETCTDTTLNFSQDLSETFVEQNDEMNIAFVQDIHTSSSPEKGSKIFESCTESPITNPNNSFVGHELTTLCGDALLGSPFVKRAPLISMSQTENSGGVKYWLSFDDSIDDNQNKSFNDSISQRVWKKSRKVDDAIPSFYKIDFGTYSENHTPSNPRSVFNQSEVSTGAKASEVSDFDRRMNRENDTDVSVDLIAERQVYTSPSSSNSYDTCKSFQAPGSPQKKLLYQVERQKLHNTWPPFEDTIFYRILSKFRMSESFDPSDLDTAKISL